MAQVNSNHQQCSDLQGSWTEVEKGEEGMLVDRERKGKMGVEDVKEELVLVLSVEETRWKESKTSRLLEADSSCFITKWMERRTEKRILKEDDSGVSKMKRQRSEQRTKG